MKSRTTSLALAATLVFGLLSTAGPASAGSASPQHTGHGVLVVESRHPISPTAIHYVVRLTWSGDNHPAEQAYVTATLIDLTGQATPVAFYAYDDDGRYAGTVELPGPGLWTVRFTSASPAVTVDHPELVYQNLLEILFSSKAA